PQVPLPALPCSDAKSTHVYALTRILITLKSPEMTINFLNSLVPRQKLLAYLFTFDLVEGGGQDFREAIRKDLPEGTEFLKRNNKVDMLILKNTKDVLEPRSSIYHTALSLQNAFMHASTTSDVFLRENLEWLVLANNRSKFSAAPAIGVIHKGHFQESMNILGPYRPVQAQDSSTGANTYMEGDALYAMGLVNAGCGSGQEVENYLRNMLRNSVSEVVQHGAALGIGVAGMGGKSAEAYDDLKQMLFTDSAVAGEAAGYAMGLIMLGTADVTSAEEMLTYAQETQHEKIIRGLAKGLALIFYGRQEEAYDMVKLLMAEKDPILRYGDVYTLALAYAGTANSWAVCELLHVAVSDTSDDVRRAAVTTLAFLLFKNPAQVPRIVQQLSKSYNPHVRCGATLALGIARAVTGLQDAVDILAPMTRDSVDFVRQGALIALGMILASSPSLASNRALYAKIVSDKHNDPMARFGIALGQGRIDARGRKIAISLQSHPGSRNTSAIVGMVLFCQFWYWYPLAHCACLVFEPTGVIGLDENLKAPKFEFISNAKPSLFAYPAATKPLQKETVAKVATAVFSTTAKMNAREKRKAAEAGETVSDEKEKKDGDVEMKGAEGSSSLTIGQLAYITFPADGHYQSVRVVLTRPPSAKAAKSATSAALAADRSGGGGGILIMADTCPDEEPDYIESETQAIVPPVAPGAAQNPPASTPGRHIALDESASEADPPESFEYPFGNDM
ncbi:armadillo-type protein, partial [Cerioporus squamosus]